MAHLQHKNDPWPEELQVQVGGLMERCFSETRRLLQQFRSALERLASELEEREDLNHEDVCALIGDVQTDTHRIIETITNTPHLQADREPLPVSSPPSKEAHALVAAS